MEQWIPLIISDQVDAPWLLAAAGLLLLGAVVLIASLIALLRLRPLSFVMRLITGALFFALGALAGAVAIGTAGYQALNREATAARIRVEPVGPQRFNATLQFPDGHTETFALAGDEIYIDAHILKWKPIASLVGLHTAYELDRIAGRYHSLADEKAAPRTVHALGTDKPIDFFNLRRRYVFLSPLLDAEYGSASFVPVTNPAQLDVRVSNTGVLLRESTPEPQQAPK
jgi:hypothetical protein